MSITRRHSILVVSLSMSLSLLACSSNDVAEEANLATTGSALSAVSSFGSNPGNLQMFEYVPTTVAANAPVVVVLHGCTQSAATYVNAGWNQLADKWGFYIVYAQQQSSNQSLSCFRWYEPGQTSRDSGEALSIKQMVDSAKARHSIDPARVFVAGLSAGGAMAAVMLATYPDVFAAGAVMSGLPYRCASSQAETSTCQYVGKSMPAADWGALVKKAYPGYAGPYPRVSIWQGDADVTVKPSNATELVKQFASVNAVDSSSASLTNTIDGATHAAYKNAAGEVRVESYIIPKMTHGTAIKPGFAPAGGCGSPGAYILDAGICSTYYAGGFFGLGVIEATDGGADPGSPSGSSSSGGLPGMPGLPGVGLPSGSFPTGTTTCGAFTCFVGNCCTAFGTCGYAVGSACVPSF